VGRQRTIDREALLDAAERVVMREGAAHLTLDGVACEAGISKASVLYDYKTKRALVRALIERRVATEQQRVQRFIDAESDRPNARIRGHLAATSRSFSDEERSVALNLCAALAQDAELRVPVQQSLGEAVAEIQRDSAHPRGAMLAFLAIEGLTLLDWFGLHSFDKPERERLIADIDWLIGQSPVSAS
jgi:AcrR family transcriptional regulator